MLFDLRRNSYARFDAMIDIKVLNTNGTITLNRENKTFVTYTILYIQSIRRLRMRYLIKKSRLFYRLTFVLGSDDLNRLFYRLTFVLGRDDLHKSALKYCLGIVCIYE